MRPALYSGVSTALAGGVVVYAFAQRPNFYSACVFLSQSNLSLMILINLCFIIAFTVVWGLSRLLYGRLRPVEVEQLYERGWFAVTETCLAMTIFRDEIGAWFISMFVALMAGRVWGWIAHGRVEILEQQPPTNPRTFHTRLTLALLVALVYNYAFVSYAAGIVYEQARPNMMVMFLFEHVLLTITTASTALKYLLCAIEIRITQRQTKQMLEARRAEIRERRGEMIRQREAAAQRGDEVTGREEPLPSENDLEEMDIEAPGWEGKGQFVLLLELLSDFMRLLVYLAFFAVLSTFFGLPIHIMRDLFVTTRSFIKRLNAVLRYRSATKDMNAKYPDATAAEIAANDTCIVCREEMRPWNQVNGDAGRTLAGNQPTRPAIPMSEGKRAKKLPCGHILHMVCLKSWLERAQVCPTCRAPVNGRAAQPAAAQQAAAPGRALGPGGQPHPLGNRAQGQQPAAANNGRGGIINLGRFQVAYGRAADPVAAAEAARAAVMAQARTPWRTQAPAPLPNPATLDIGELIRRTEQRIMEEAARLESQREDLAVLKRMQQELSRLRMADREQRDQRQEEQPTASTSVPPARDDVIELQQEQRSATPSAPTASSTADVASPSPNPTDEAVAAVVTDGPHSPVGQADGLGGTEAEDQQLPASPMEDNAQEGTNSLSVGGSSIRTASSISHQHSAPSTDGAGPSSSHTAPTATSGEGGDIAPSDGTTNPTEGHPPHFDGLGMAAEQSSSNDVGNADANATPNQATSTNAENTAADGEIRTTSSAESADETGLQRSGA